MQDYQDNYKRLVEIIDTTYRLTSRDGGYKGGLTRLLGENKNFQTRVLRELRKRGVLLLQGRRSVTYRWSPTAMAPTETFYKSVAKSVNLKPAAPTKPKEEHAIGVVKAGEHAGKVAVASLEPFSDQELWDELKKRGARIVDGTLRIVKEVTLR